VTSKQILIVNAWHDDNKGDAAITIGTIIEARERWPGCAITVTNMFRPSPPGASRHVAAFAGDSVKHGGSVVPTLGLEGGKFRSGIWALKIAAIWGMIRLGFVPRGLKKQIEKYDVVLLCGGSNLYSGGGLEFVGTLRLKQMLLPAVVAARCGKEFRLWGHSLGPFANDGDRALLKSVLSDCEEIWLRESASVAALEEASIDPERISVQRDLAFKLSPDDSTRVKDLISALDGDFVAIVLRRHPYLAAEHEARLASELAAWANELVASGSVKHVAVVAHTLGPIAVEDDRDAARALAARIGDNALLIEDDLSPSELVAFYGASRGTVAVRLHAAILALTGGAPAFAISYFSPKTPGVMALEGLDDSWGEYETLSRNELQNWAEKHLSPATTVAASA
jgi:polysaccharide pyruvyl transferase WcaK-like protein